MIARLKRIVAQVKRFIPFPILKYGDVLVQSVNPVFWVRAVRSIKEFCQLIAKQRVELNTFAEQNGLSAIMYFTGDISIYIDQQKVKELDEEIVEKFTSDLRNKSHTITRLPSVIITWIGQIAGLSTYWNWEFITKTVNQTVNTLQGLL